MKICVDYIFSTSINRVLTGGKVEKFKLMFQVGESVLSKVDEDTMLKMLFSYI